MANLVTRQRCRQLAAVGAVDLARIKTVVAQFVLHRAHVFIGRSRSGERKSVAIAKKTRRMITLLYRRPLTARSCAK